MMLNELFDLKGKTAIVTGGARGIGKFLAKGLAEAGANLVIASRKLETCEAFAAELADAGTASLAVQCDMAKTEQIENLITESEDRFGQIDILINNAGVTWGAPTLEYPLDKWEKVFTVNTRGVWVISQAVANKMKTSGGGRIINVSSVLASRGTDELTHPAVAYNSSKAAVEVLTKNLAVKLAPYQINVNCIAPGFFHTDMMAYIFDPKLEKQKENVLMQIPCGRIGTEDDIKALGVFLASEASRYINGAIIAVDGGMGAK